MMKTIIILIIFTLFWVNLVAQAPQAFKYQAVAHNASGDPLKNKTVSFRISILKTSITGSSVYSETHLKTTNDFGLVDLEIGKGSSPAGSFTGIDWGADSYFIKVEFDPEGGTSYQLMGTSQLLSVPYALYAKNAGNGSFWSPSASNIYFNKGNVGIGTTDPLNLLHVNGEARIENSRIGYRLELNYYGTGNRYAFIDFHGDDEYTDYGLRIMRSNTGPDAKSEILHRGKGDFNLFTQDDAPIHFYTKNKQRMTITPDGKVEIGELTIGDTIKSTAEVMKFSVRPTGNIDYLKFYAFRKNAGTSWENVSWRIQQRVDASDMGYIEFNSGTGQRDIAFGTNNTERLRITLGGDVVMANQNIKNMANPVEAQDAVTKAYIDELLSLLNLLPKNFAGIISDVDGNRYKTVQLNKVWMAENLRTTHYNDGTPLNTWNLLTDAFCWYDDFIGNKDSYGALYNWFAVNNRKKLCPSGWHVPSDAEWSSLIEFLGGESVAGGKMKETGTTHWLSPNSGATNESGFSGLAGGMRGAKGCGGIGEIGYWWSSTEEFSSTNAWCRYLNYNSNSTLRSNRSKDLGFSVRCVRDNV